MRGNHSSARPFCSTCGSIPAHAGKPQRLGIPPGGLFIDPVGDPMWVGDELFTRASGQSKLKKRDRHVYLDAFGQVLADPDEMYLELDTRQNGQTRLVKKMLRYFKTEQGKTHALIALFAYQPDKTQGVSLYVIDNENTVEKKRTGRLIYSKKRQDGQSPTGRSPTGM